jgi:D-alanine-D-alanine ligase
LSGLRVALIAGGPSAEAEVSRTSARGVFAALERAGHAPTLFELDGALARKLAAASFDVAFPVTHGPLGEDGCLQGLLEVQGLPYVGSQVLASALAASKPHAKALFRAQGLPLADEALLERSQDFRKQLAQIRARFAADLVLKPASGGSAIGVEVLTKAASDAEAEAAAERAFELEPSLLVERFTPGLEVTCGVLEEGSALRALPPTWIRPKASGHYDFVSKYRDGGSEHVCPAPFAPALSERIQGAALLAHRALGCRDLSRVDFIVDTAGEGSFIVLEVNTLPGMTPVSLFPEAAAAAGIPFESLCDRLVQRAFARPRRQAQVARAMP